MKIDIRHPCAGFDTYRAARVKSLFNVEDGAGFALCAELPVDDGNWPGVVGVASTAFVPRRAQ